LRDANFVINAIQVGGYEPATVIDFEIPKKYGLKQTIGDTLGIGGIFRGLRTIPVMLSFVEEMERVCPNALLMNYTNPMSILTGAVLQNSSIKTIGLCHSVQTCVSDLYRFLDWEYPKKGQGIVSYIAGINHMAWLLRVEQDGQDMYPEIKKQALEMAYPHEDRVRFKIMEEFGYYVTESSEHSSEYYPYFIKSKYPEFIEEYKILLDEYPIRCINQIKAWEEQRDEYVANEILTHEKSHEYASYIMDAIVSNKPLSVNVNVLNEGLITNLPNHAVVEVPCLVDANGIQPTVVGALPSQLAALNQTHINVHQLVIEAAVSRSKDKLIQAALLDPHTASELSIDEIKAMVEEMIIAHQDYLPILK
ncbi:MAG TPA: alpha-galactosidase, partial [Erysipelothrix sp.]